MMAPLEGGAMADSNKHSRGGEWLQGAAPRGWCVAAASEGGTLAFVGATLVLMVLFRQAAFATFEAPAGVAEFLAACWADLVPHAGTAIVMLIVVEPVRRGGPDAGLRRVAALALAVMFGGALATTLRCLWLIHVAGSLPSAVWPAWVIMFTRFSGLGALLVLVSEYHRHAVRSLDAMHAADADRDQLEQQMLQARLRTLEAQIEPHFLFNSLATVRRLYETDLAAGEAMLGRLMRYLEVALPSMRSQGSTLAREAELIEAYLELQRVRMGRRLEFGVDIAPALRLLEVPSMMLLTLVENAIKHGLAPQREGGRVDVTARMDGALLRLEVADTGRGFGGDTSGGGTGLANIHARLSALFGDAAAFTLTVREPRGLCAAICLPVSSR